MDNLVAAPVTGVVVASTDAAVATLGAVSATDTQLRSDQAQTLVTTALLAGEDAAHRAARRVVVADRLRRAVHPGPGLIQAVPTLGASPVPLPLGPVYALQLAVSDVTIAIPTMAARVAVNIRFFERHGVPAGTALNKHL
jgi:hypothetical protein